MRQTAARQHNGKRDRPVSQILESRLLLSATGVYQYSDDAYPPTEITAPGVTASWSQPLGRLTDATPTLTLSGLPAHAYLSFNGTFNEGNCSDGGFVVTAPGPGTITAQQQWYNSSHTVSATVGGDGTATLPPCSIGLFVFNLGGTFASTGSTATIAFHETGDFSDASDSEDYWGMVALTVTVLQPTVSMTSVGNTFTLAAADVVSPFQTSLEIGGTATQGTDYTWDHTPPSNLTFSSSGQSYRFRVNPDPKLGKGPRTITLKADGGDGYTVASPDTARTTIRGHAPAAPTGFAATATYPDPTDASSNQVHLTWNNASSNNQTGYDLQRSNDGSQTWQDMAGPGAGDTSADDTGRKPGNYTYRLRATNEAGKSAWATTSVGVWPPGVLVSFDGTWGFPNHDQFLRDAHTPDDWGGDWGGTTVIPLFTDLYRSPLSHYYRGVGNAMDHPNEVGQDFQAVSTQEAMGTVVAALNYLGQQYHNLMQTDLNAEHDMPVDLLGYSRGAVQAVKLANLIAACGVPDPATEHDVEVQGTDMGGNTVYWPEHVYDRWFHPAIRFIGLISPVYLMDPASAVLATFGLPQVTGDWPTMIPGAVRHIVVLHDSDPNQFLRNETFVTRVGGNTYGDFESPPLPFNHGDLGMQRMTLNQLLDHANEDNVPVPPSTIDIAVCDGRVTDWQPTRII